MKQRGLKPNVITYSSLIGACSKGNETEKASEVCADMKRSGLQPDVITFNALIMLARRATGQKARNLRGHDRSGLKPKVIT